MVQSLRDSFFRQYPPIRCWVCSDRVSLRPGLMDGPRDRHGAIVQPPGKGGKTPYEVFVWERGYRGPGTMSRPLPLRDKKAEPRQLSFFANGTGNPEGDPRRHAKAENGS